jgi:hypothetical protein
MPMPLLFFAYLIINKLKAYTAYLTTYKIDGGTLCLSQSLQLLILYCTTESLFCPLLLSLPPPSAFSFLPVPIWLKKNKIFTICEKKTF